MNAPVFKALVLDALYQVLDNKVFRILAVLTLIPIAFTFLLGFREDRVVLLFGWKSFAYSDWLTFFQMPRDVGDPQGLIINSVVSVVVSVIAGTIGILFCISATSFFVPRMIEKGAADVLFHKPVSRLVLYLSRYAAGLIFIGGLSIIMVGGMYVGLLLVSGYGDPGILCAALSLVYLFAIVHAVSMWIGVLTRSTVASILLSILFFVGNGCVHSIWVLKETIKADEEAQKGDPGRRSLVEVKHGDSPEEPTPKEDGAPSEGEQEVIVEHESTPAFLLTLEKILNGMHYVLPKTADSDILATKLRRAITPHAYKHAESDLAVFREPEGTGLVDPGRAVPADLAAILGELDAEPLFAVRDAQADVSWVLFGRLARDEEITRPNGKQGTRTELASRLAATVKDALEVAGVGEVTRGSREFGSHDGCMPRQASSLDWVQGTDAAARGRTLLVLRLGTIMHFVLIDAPAAQHSDEAARSELVQRLSNASGVPMNASATFYEEKMGWTTPVPYNLIFSIATTLAFTLVVLFLGWWKLRRIEF
jgi:ABC-type transport system involved in multi-copper enzyme maturation permease subunit